MRLSGLLTLVRHAPAKSDGRLAGRRDVPAILDDGDAVSRLRAWIGPPGDVVVSPALRCRQTAQALFPDQSLQEDARLWEQDFGTHEGLPASELPDHGALDRAELTQIAAPEGESFAAMVARVTPALRMLADKTASRGPVTVVAHAGTVRAGLALALGDLAAALAFEVEPLSATRLRCLPNAFSIVTVNHVA